MHLIRLFSFVCCLKYLPAYRIEWSRELCPQVQEILHRDSSILLNSNSRASLDDSSKGN